MANILINIAKGVEVAAEDVLEFITAANKIVQGEGPAAVAAIGVLAAALDKAFNDAAAVAANPTSLTLAFASDVADIKAVWPAVKALLAIFRVKV
jgi:hypothetical protein